MFPCKCFCHTVLSEDKGGTGQGGLGATPSPALDYVQVMLTCTLARQDFQAVAPGLFRRSLVLIKHADTTWDWNATLISRWEQTGVL